MKNVGWIILLFCMITVPVWGQRVVVRADWGDDHPNPHHILYHPERPLLKSDFKGRAPSGGRAVALTKSSMGFSSSFSGRDNLYTFTIKVNALFDTKGSWFKNNRNEAQVLAHEQIHFDLTAYYAYQFLNAVRHYPFTVKNYRHQLNRIYNEYADALTKAQNDYDSQTQNGTNITQQERWSKRVAEMMERLQPLYGKR